MSTSESRRRFIEFMLASPLLAAAPVLARPEVARPETLKQALNVNHLKLLAQQELTLDDYHFIVGGADDMLTTEENEAAFRRIKVRPRRLVDVSDVNTSVNLFGKTYDSPIVLAPVGNQARIHVDADMASARAAQKRKHLMVAPMMGNYPVEALAETGASLWFQLYPSTNRELMVWLAKRAETAGCDTLVLTVDGPTRGNHEAERWFRMTADRTQQRTRTRLGNLEGFDGKTPIGDPSFTWDDLQFLRDATGMNLVLKGVVTGEDARLCRRYGVDGVIVSNHGGRQEGNGRGTADVLPEVVNALKGKMPVLVDGGVRRGADVFKALAEGADAVCIGRPYLWGLGAAGQQGAEKCLKILQAELVRTMQYAGTPDIAAIRPAHIYRNGQGRI